jgi:hypothetical protein
MVFENQGEALQKDDIILSVDGELASESNVVQLLRGPDVVGSRCQSMCSNNLGKRMRERSSKDTDACFVYTHAYNV